LKLPTDRCTSVTSPHRWAGRPTKRPPRGYRLVQEASIGYIVGKEIRLADGVGIVFHLTRPVRPDLWVVVDGRTWAVEHVEHPDAELATADRRRPRDLDRKRRTGRRRHARPAADDLIQGPAGGPGLNPARN
jgi:hypothetical protein